MSSYYSGRRAQHYNNHWRTFTKRTLAEALAVIDEARLRRVPEELGHPPRVLDVACGTGILLRHLLERVPGMEAYGVDASADILAEAQALCARAGLHVVYGKAFPVDWFWRGWALRADYIVSVC